MTAKPATKKPTPPKTSKTIQAEVNAGVYSAQEMARRNDMVRGWMARNSVEYCLFTSDECVTYFAEQDLGGQGGGLALAQRHAWLFAPRAFSPSQGAAQPAYEMVCYAQADDFYTSAQAAIKAGRRLGIEFDRVSLDFRKSLMDAFPGVEFVDVAAYVQFLQSLKSQEEHVILGQLSIIAETGYQALQESASAGRAAYEIAALAEQAMQKASVKCWPNTRHHESRCLVQASSHTKLKSGDMLQVFICAQAAGLRLPLWRSLVVGKAKNAWRMKAQDMLDTHQAALNLLRPEASGDVIAMSLRNLHSHQASSSTCQIYSLDIKPRNSLRDSATEIREDHHQHLLPGMLLCVDSQADIMSDRDETVRLRELDVMLITETEGIRLTKQPQSFD